MRHVLAALLLAAPAVAGGVQPGDEFITLDGGTVSADMRGGIHGDYTVRFTDDVGRSPGSTATPTIGGCPGEVDYSEEGVTFGPPEPDGTFETGGTYRIGKPDGKPPKPGGMYQKDDKGNWRKLRKKPGKKGADHPGQCSSWGPPPGAGIGDRGGMREVDVTGIIRFNGTPPGGVDIDLDGMLDPQGPVPADMTVYGGVFGPGPPAPRGGNNRCDEYRTPKLK